MPHTRHPSGEIPWEAIRLAYISSDKSIRTLAGEFVVSKASIGARSKEEDWVGQRAEYRATVGTAALARLQEADAQHMANQLGRINNICDTIIDQLEAAFVADPNQITTHLVQREESWYDAATKDRGTRKTAEALVTTMINGRNASDLSAALKNLQYIKRLYAGLMTPESESKLALERERLDMAKQQAGLRDEDGDGLAYGVVELPSMDESQLEGSLPDPRQEQEGLS